MYKVYNESMALTEEQKRMIKEIIERYRDVAEALENFDRTGVLIYKGKVLYVSKNLMQKEVTH